MENKDIKVCKYCSSEIPKTASVCPKCQKDLRNWFVKHYIISIILVVFIGIPLIQGMLSVQDNVDNNKIDTNIQKIEVKEEVIKITSSELFSKYKENEINADNLYKSKILEISGGIDSIGKDILDNPYVALKTGDYVFTVQCMLEDGNQASELKKGENIIVVGKNSGKMGNVLIRDCNIK